MSVSFPLSDSNPQPTGFALCSFPKRNGVFYVGDTVSVSLSQAGATAYTVRDITGTVVSSGSVSGTTVTPTPPAGGWNPGWYRLYLTGASTDPVYGQSLGATNFCVVRADSHFPTMPAVGTNNSGGGEQPDLCAKGVLGIGTSRIQIGDVRDPNGAGSGSDTLTQALANVAIGKTFWTQVSPADPNRPRYLFASFPNGTVDSLTLLDSGGSGSLVFYCRTGALDGSTVTVASAAGSSSGVKITVVHGGTTETFDNLSNDPFTAAPVIDAGSSLVRCFVPHFNNGNPPAPHAATAIGNAYFNGVKTCVTALYPDVQWFEGPFNEPRIDSTLATEVAHQMTLFSAAVKAGNASAKAIGPTPVQIHDLLDGGITAAQEFGNFLTAGGTVADGYAFHVYNDINGDLNMGRFALQALVDVLAAHGESAKPIWQTEQGTTTPVFAVHHPRRSRWQLVQTLLQEQYGIRREQNNVWYDLSHGFWSVPCWWQNADTSLQPQAVALRVLAEETWGKPYASRLNFGEVADDMWLGSVYTSPSDTTSTVVILGASYMPNGSVALTLSGTVPTSVTVVDGFGNTSTATVTDSVVTVPITGEWPTYIRLPAGTSATVYSVNGWLGDKAQQHDSLRHYAVAMSGTDKPSLLNSTTWPVLYDGTTDKHAIASLPATVTVKWGTPRTLDRVVIWAGAPWQGICAPTDFDVQTSNDGTTWTTRATITVTADSFKHGTDWTNTGCQYETYWTEQWVFDVALPAPVTAQYVRLYVRAASYGGEPDSQSVTAGGQGTATPLLTLRKIKTMCVANGQRQIVMA